MARRNTTLTGAAGEHFVMYRLLQQGHLAAFHAQRNGEDGRPKLVTSGIRELLSTYMRAIEKPLIQYDDGNAKNMSQIWAVQQIRNEIQTLYHGQLQYGRSDYSVLRDYASIIDLATQFDGP